ncbi:MAG: MoaD/ThiS family protein [Luteibaculum sp.]
MATLKIPSPLRKFTNNQSEIAIEANTIQDSIEAAAKQYPDLKNQLFDEAGNIRSFVRIYLGDEDIKALNNEATQVETDSVISIIPAIAGGSLS